jgi:hypothetical protein
MNRSKSTKRTSTTPLTNDDDQHPDVSMEDHDTHDAAAEAPVVERKRRATNTTGNVTNENVENATATTDRNDVPPASVTGGRTSRASTGSNGTSTGTGTTNTTAAEAGIIKVIKCENFMCHRKLTVDLNRNVTFIHGQNGSGMYRIILLICSFHYLSYPLSLLTTHNVPYFCFIVFHYREKCGISRHSNMLRCQCTSDTSCTKFERSDPT